MPRANLNSRPSVKQQTCASCALYYYIGNLIDSDPQAVDPCNHTFVDGFIHEAYYTCYSWDTRYVTVARAALTYSAQPQAVPGLSHQHTLISFHFPSSHSLIFHIFILSRLYKPTRLHVDTKTFPSNTRYSASLRDSLSSDAAASLSVRLEITQISQETST